MSKKKGPPTQVWEFRTTFEYHTSANPSKQVTHTAGLLIAAQRYYELLFFHCAINCVAQHPLLVILISASDKFELQKFELQSGICTSSSLPIDKVHCTRSTDRVQAMFALAASSALLTTLHT